MRIAVASQNFRTVTGHAGKSRRFLVFDVAPVRTPPGRAHAPNPPSDGRLSVLRQVKPEPCR